MKETPIGPIIMDIDGLVLTQEDAELISHPHVGGVIFFSRNYTHRQQLADLAKQIKRIRPNCVLCVDQEGGRVQRFKNEMTRLPHLRILGDLIESQNVPLSKACQFSEKLGQLMALEVRALGVDLSFAPVLDLDTGMSEVIGNRAFHRTPDMVVELAKAYIKGMLNAGMKATGKHFPGHGSVTLDSHFALPEDTRAFDEIKPDMWPFQQLITHGIAALMPAHIVYPQIDPLPVGFSKYWLQTVLRQQLQFKGTIVSDDLTMEGAKGLGNYAERAHIALNAGCDFVLVCNNRKGAIEAIEGISPSFGSEEQARRLNMLAQGETPTWQELNQTAIWKACQESLKELQQISHFEMT
jgi:beta-N-acetylhexosaminidase